jgi:hypothetical protein
MLNLWPATCSGRGHRHPRGGPSSAEHEPLPADHPCAIITPHMSFYSVEAQAVEEVVRVLAGREPRCPVNREVIPA